MPRKLAPVPSPPASLNDRALPITTIDLPLIRIHRLHQDPAFWGRTGNNRFDAPSGAYGVLYTSESFDGAFIEAFGDLSPKTVSVSSLTTRGVATVAARRGLQLVDLAGAGLSQLGLDARICNDDHAVPQQWSMALWAHPSQPDGLRYSARHDANQRSVAIFDRAAPAVAVTASGGSMTAANGASTARALEKYGFTLLP